MLFLAGERSPLNIIFKNENDTLCVQTTHLAIVCRHNVLKYFKGIAAFTGWLRDCGRRERTFLIYLWKNLRATCEIEIRRTSLRSFTVQLFHILTLIAIGGLGGDDSDRRNETLFRC